MCWWWSDGPESTELYECMGNLSCVYLVAGKFQEALKLAQEALVAQQRILGRAHPSTLMSIAGVGKVCCNRLTSYLHLLSI